MANHFVECFSSRSYPGQPKALWWENDRLEVEETERQWRTQGVTRSEPVLYHYLVRTARGRFHLIYDALNDEWDAARTESDDRKS